MKHSCYDLVIVGAGPSGTSTAITGLKRGLSVLLIDAKSFPRIKACGGLLTQKSLRLIQTKLGIAPNLIPAVSKCNKISINYKDEMSVNIESKEEYYITHRKLFDDFLLQTYLSLGGEFIQNKISPEDVHFEDNSVTLKNNRIRFKLLVGADGATSRLRKFLDPEYRPNGFALESIGQNVKSIDPSILIRIGNVKNGYDWLFPLGNFSNIGTGTSNPKEAISYFENNPFTSNTTPASLQVIGAYLPLGRLPKKISSSKLVLVGDAAGLIDPIFGEGIFFSLKSGIHVAESFENGQFNEKKYLNCLSIIHSSIHRGNVIKKYLLYNRHFSPKIVPFLLKKKILCTFIADTYLNQELSLGYNLFSLFLAYRKFKRQQYYK